MQWLLFLSQLPANPSGLRVSVWRKLRAQGALGLQNGVWILPDQPEQLAFFNELSEMVQKQGAGSQIFTVNSLSEAVELEIIQKFKDNRAEEYAEVKEQCADFLLGLEKEIQRRNFSFAEYEENEQDLNKLENWIVKVKQRDFWGGSPVSEAEEWLEQCRQKFQEFTALVFANEDEDHARKMKYDPGPLNPANPSHPAADGEE